MRFQNLALISAFAAFITAQDIDQNDIPEQCTVICADVVTISQSCDDTTNDDTSELDCICSAPNAGTLIPTCEACIAQYDNDDDDDDDDSDRNDVYDILTHCNFATRTYNSKSADLILSSIASASQSAFASSVVVVTTSGTVVLTTNAPASTQATAIITGGGAPAKTAAVGMGLLGLVVGIM